MRGFVLFLTLLSLLSYSRCTRVLLIGDSIDRLSVQEYCEEHHYYSEIPPFHEPLKTSNKAVDAYYCKSSDQANHSLAYLHLHGSNSTRPYWMDHTRAHAQLENSIDRLQFGLVNFLNVYPVPHIIYLHTAQWDAAQLNYVYATEEINKVHSLSWNISVSFFISSMKERIEQIKSLVSNVTTECGPVKVGLRTAIYSPKFQKSFIPTLLFEMNRIIVELSRAHNLILYDANEDFWSRYHHNYEAHDHLFRDYIHPIKPLLATMATKLMGLQYTSYYTQAVEMMMCASLPVHPSLWLSPTFSSASHFSYLYQKIILISNKNSKDDVYFVEYRSRKNKTIVTSHRYANEQFQTLVSLGESDIYYTAEDITRTSLVEGAHIPPLFRANSSDYRYLVNCSYFSAAYVVDKTLKWREITFPMLSSEAKYYHAWDIALDCNELQHFYHFLSQEVIQRSLISHELPDIYRSNVLARYRLSTEIFAMLNGTKRSIANMDVFNAHDWSIDDIKVVHAIEDLDVIPVGPTLADSEAPFCPLRRAIEPQSTNGKKLSLEEENMWGVDADGICRNSFLKMVRSLLFLLLLATCSCPLCALTTPSKVISSILIASSFGNVPEAINTIMRNPDSALCSLDTMMVDDFHGSCQQLDDIVRVRAGKVLTIRQDWGGSASTGASVWNGANMISWYLENTLGRNSLKDSSVIELGAGVGFTSLVAQALGSTDVLITDGNEDVLKLASTNIKINVPKDELNTIKTGRLRWNTEDEESYLTSSSKRPWDYIIAADVTYLKKNRPLLFSTITKLSGPNTATILSMEPRNVGEVEDVLEEAKKNGFNWKEERLPVDPLKSQCNLLCARLFILSKL